MSYKGDYITTPEGRIYGAQGVLMDVSMQARLAEQMSRYLDAINIQRKKEVDALRGDEKRVGMCGSWGDGNPCKNPLGNDVIDKRILQVNYANINLDAKKT